VQGLGIQINSNDVIATIGEHHGGGLADTGAGTCDDCDGLAHARSLFGYLNLTLTGSSL
jgi:hypothetical protein